MSRVEISRAPASGSAVRRRKAPSPSPRGSLLEELLLIRVCDLDQRLAEAEMRDLVDGFEPSYLLISLPKSSSTFSTAVLSNILGAAIYKDIVTQDDFTPKDLSVPGIVAGRHRPTVSQVHLTATGANLRIMRNFRLPYVILLRNIFDVVVSMRDHMSRSPYFSSVLIPQSYAALGEQERMDYIVDTAVPWMMTFYSSWFAARARGDVKGDFFLYEDMVGEPVGFFKTIAERLGHPVSATVVEAGIAKVEKSTTTRFNVGARGRGEKEIGPDARARIRRFADYYPGIDFEPLGL